MQFFEGQLRIEVLPTAIDFRVIGFNGEAGTEKALEKIGRLVELAQGYKMSHETHRRKYGDGYRADAVVIRTIQCDHPRTNKITRGGLKREECLDCGAEFADRTPLDEMGGHRDEVG